MEERDKYTLPRKSKGTLTRISYIGLCFLGAIITVLLLDVYVYHLFRTNIGFFPTSIIISLADFLYLIGCGKYVYKHDYAYGTHYEISHVFNAEIFGLQYFLFVFLIACIINALVIPIYYSAITFAVIIILFRLTRRR